MNFDGTDDSDEDVLPSSIVVDGEDGQMSPISRSVMLDQSPASPIDDYKTVEETTPINDNDDDGASSSSSTSSGSLDLNPNSSLDAVDLPGIDLLKEIFPEENTSALRKMHYKHILMNKSPPSSTSLSVALETPTEQDLVKNTLVHSISPNDSMGSGGDDQEIGETRKHNSTSLLAGVNELPDEDFLRLPKSVAVLRNRKDPNETGENRGQTYEFIKDLEMQALEEYHLAGTNQRIHPGGKYVDYMTYVVDRDDRLGLGMSLQEVLEAYNPVDHTEQGFLGPGDSDMGYAPQHAVIRYGFMVIGFKPDTKKNQNSASPGQNTKSPAEAAGIECDDVIIGINGTAFLLQMPLSSSPPYTVDMLSDRYKDQKKRIIHSIQNSPTPVVLHIRRKRTRSMIEKRFVERNSTSLLDASTMEDLERDDLRQFDSAETDATPSSPNDLEHSTTSLQPSLSPAFYDTKLAAVPDVKLRPEPHPLSVALAERKLIRPGEDQWRITRRLQQFTERARQCESSNSLRIFLTGKGSGVRGSLAPHFDPIDLPPDMADLMVFQNGGGERANKDPARDKQSNPFAADASTSSSSTPTLQFDSPLIPMEYLQAFYGEKQAREIRTKSSFVYDNAQKLGTNGDDMAWIPLHGIRKGLSARIVNSFVENNSDKSDNTQSRIAYTIWVYDLESGREWYAPIRYWQDFADLREAALNSLPTNSNVYKELSVLKFARDPTIPNSGWGATVFGSPSMLSPMRRKRRNDDFDEARQQTSQSLEEFLRELLGIVYTCYPLHTSTAEIALYVQSFLGVDAGLQDCSESFSDLRSFKNPSEREEDETRKRLKRSIQRYSWRIFLLHTMKAIVKDFVDAARARGPKLHDVEYTETDMTAMKTRAMDELLQIQKFLDQLVDLILEGCHDDLDSIAKRREYSAIHKNLSDETYWDRLMREAVREQVEIEVYVPLRSVVSRLLVNGWRHEDMEVHFKIKELRKRPQGMFRIEKTSPSHWQSVARILKQGVGMSTLPCVKLRAIVDAAREISQLHDTEHGGKELLGADEFLPIFIFCVVRAEMERPCALSILLQTLCDRINRIGEIGYFLASFEAAIAHIEGIDLAEDREDMLSFLTVPLTEVSLNE